MASAGITGGSFLPPGRLESQGRQVTGGRSPSREAGEPGAGRRKDEAWGRGGGGGGWWDTWDKGWRKQAPGSASLGGWEAQVRGAEARQCPRPGVCTTDLDVMSRRGRERLCLELISAKCDSPV